MIIGVINTIYIYCIHINEWFCGFICILNKKMWSIFLRIEHLSIYRDETILKNVTHSSVMYEWVEKSWENRQTSSKMLDFFRSMDKT